MRKMDKTPLYKQIQQAIKTKISSGELRPKDRIPSEQELMDEFMVSKITVKNALAALVDERLVVRIQGKGTFVAAEPHTALPASGPAFRPSRTGNLIGFIIPTMKTRVIQKLVDHVEYFVKEAGYQLVLHITRESSAEETRAVHDLTESDNVKGMIVFPTEDETYNESLLRLSLDKFPFVFIDRYLRNIDTYRVTSDNFGGAYEAVAMLLNQGHRRIALISPDKTNTTIEDRTAGFEKAFIDHGILIDKGLWCHVPIRVLRQEGTLEYITEFLNAHRDITAAFTFTAEMANLTHRAIRHSDHLNQEIGMVSFDDPEIPNIPHLLQDEHQMAKFAVQLLIQQFEGDYQPQKIEIPVSFP